MQSNTNHIEQYINNFDIFLQNPENSANSEILTLRDRAFSIFKSKGFPQKKDEEWRFTDLKPLISNNFKLLDETNRDSAQEEEVCMQLSPDYSGMRITFINGRYSAACSNMGERSNGKWLLQNIADLQKTDPQKISEIFSASPAKTDNSFSALNTAFFSDGCWIEIPDDVALSEPIHIYFYNTHRNFNFITNPRIQVMLGKNSKASVIESYIGLEDSGYFTNTVSDIYLADNADLKYYKIQNESGQSYHIANTFISQKDNSRFNSLSFNLGSDLVRNNIYSILDGPGIECNINGLYLGRGEQHIDNHILVDHAHPYCSSNQLFRGILSDKSRGVFSGKVLVRPNAQRTEAKQSNDCLLLSEEAKIDSKPQLEIYADDVKCSHGATVGQLDENAFFYLKSRGIGDQAAKNILINAFAKEVLDTISVPQVKEEIGNLLSRRMQNDALNQSID